MHRGKQQIGVLSGIGGWAGIGLAAGLIDPGQAQAWHDAAGRGGEGDRTVATAGLGAVGAYQSLANFTQLGGQLTVFSLP